MFRLCQEFGWTPRQVRDLSTVDVERFMVILNEMQRGSSLAAADDDATTIVITE